MFKNIADIKAAAKDKNSAVPFWFDESTMEFFNTRVMDEVFNMGRYGTLFITSDRANFDDEERFAIRWAHIKDDRFNIHTLGNLRDYDSADDAWEAADALSSVMGDIVNYA